MLVWVCVCLHRSVWPYASNTSRYYFCPSGLQKKCIDIGLIKIFIYHQMLLTVEAIFLHPPSVFLHIFKFFLKYSSHVSCHETSCIVQCWLQLPLSGSMLFFQYHVGIFSPSEGWKKMSVSLLLQSGRDFGLFVVRGILWKWSGSEGLAAISSNRIVLTAGRPPCLEENQRGPDEEHTRSNPQVPWKENDA